MEIPDYLIKAIYTHYKRIVENARCDSRDVPTRNALRLASGELRRLKKLLTNDE